MTRVTNPPQGPSYPAGHDPSQGARPDHAAPTERIAPPVPPTEQIPHRGTPQHGPTECTGSQAPPAEPPTRQIHGPDAPVHADAPATTTQPRSRAAATPAKKERMRRFAKDPLSIVLIIAIICALGLAALLGGELYARHKASSAVAQVLDCAVRDNPFG
jgi:hypothetical protein